MILRFHLFIIEEIPSLSNPSLKTIHLLGSRSQTNEYDSKCYQYNISTESIYCANLNSAIYDVSFLSPYSDSPICYISGLVPCPQNYTSNTGYYPNCCRYCINNFFNETIKIISLFPCLVSYDLLQLEHNMTQFNNSGLSKAFFSCSFKYITTITLPECYPNGYIQWIISGSNGTSIIFSNTSFSIEGNRIVSNISLLSIVLKQINTTNTKNVNILIIFKILIFFLKFV